MPRILVVAPRFPSLNQAWMDTYLEQLQKAGIEFCIYSAMAGDGVYHRKVDELGLRDHVVDFSLQTNNVLKALLQVALKRPMKFLQAFWSTRMPGNPSASLRERWMTRLKVMHFFCVRERFGHIDLIHSHAEHLAYDFLQFARQLHVPIMLTFHGLPPTGVGQLVGWKRAELYAELRAVLVNTLFTQRQVEGLGCPGDKIHIIPQGIPLEDFPFVQRDSPSRHAPLRLLTVGRYHRDNGVGYLLVALRRLLDQGLDVHWHFVGEGPHRRAMVRLVERLGLQASVTIHAAMQLAELRSYLQSCHLFVLGSSFNGLHRWIETQGVVLQEAQASGCVPIATAVGGIVECIHDGSDGLLIKDKSSRAVVRAVAQVIDAPLLYRELQQQGRRNVEQRFSAEVVGARVAALISRLGGA